MAPKLWKGIRRVSQAGALLPQPKAKTHRAPPLSKLQRDFLARTPRPTRLLPREPDTPPPGWKSASMAPATKAPSATGTKEVRSTRKRRRTRSPSSSTTTEWLPATGSCTLQVGTVTLSTNDPTYGSAPRTNLQRAAKDRPKPDESLEHIDKRTEKRTRRPMAKPRPKTRPKPAFTVDNASPQPVEKTVEDTDAPMSESTTTRPHMPPKPKQRPRSVVHGLHAGSQTALASSTAKGRADSSDLVPDSDRNDPKTTSAVLTRPALVEGKGSSTTRRHRDPAIGSKEKPAQRRTPPPPRVPKSIWFDFDDDPQGPTSPVLPVAAPAKRKRASRRQMFQTVLRISAVNRAADDASGAGAPESFCNSRRPHMSALHDCGCTALLLYVTSGALTHGPRSVVAPASAVPKGGFCSPHKFAG